MGNSQLFTAFVDSQTLCLYKSMEDEHDGLGLGIKDSRLKIMEWPAQSLSWFGMNWTEG